MKCTRQHPAAGADRPHGDAGQHAGRLSWNVAVGAGSYRVKRATTSGGPYTTIASPFTTSYTDSGLTNGTTYYYVISAVNSAGESPDSSQVSATPQLLPPAPPTNLNASMDNRNSGVINLRWTQSSSGASSSQ